ncbi:hypothetical protein B0H14DRAFT_2634920 [Mycena olivaceomarginata]|nr:hypothetical protein B0H14DRAFT_2634920 [Mycena olivaceomarginata]
MFLLMCAVPTLLLYHWVFGLSSMTSPPVITAPRSSDPGTESDGQMGLPVGKPGLLRSSVSNGTALRLIFPDEVTTLNLILKRSRAQWKYEPVKSEETQRRPLSRARGCHWLLKMEWMGKKLFNDGVRVLDGYNAQFKLLQTVPNPLPLPFVTKNVQCGSYLDDGRSTISPAKQPLYYLGSSLRSFGHLYLCEETLKYAKSNCARNHLELTDATRRLLEIDTQLLETHSVTTWEELVEYLQNLRDIVQNINQCAKDVKEIQRSTLGGFQLTIEAERQREFFEGIKELREIHNTVVSGRRVDGKPSLWIGNYIHTGSV